MNVNLFCTGIIKILMIINHKCLESKMYTGLVFSLVILHGIHDIAHMEPPIPSQGGRPGNCGGNLLYHTLYSLSIDNQLAVLR